MLKQRVITAIILAVSAALLLFYANNVIWQGVLLVVAMIASWEWAALARVSNRLLRAAFSLVVVLLSWLATERLSAEIFLYLTALEALLLIYVVYRYQVSQGEIGPQSKLFILFTGVLAIVLFTVSITQFRSVFSAEGLLLSMFVIWAIDTGAYFSGRRFGKRKLAVYVSPGKTWEGVWGGMLLSAVVAWSGLTLLSVSATLPVFAVIIAMVFIAMFSVLGDLFESVLKRQAGMKDSGTILPGHGGALDRIDSLLIAMPMFYLLWLLGGLG